ncbi:MAG TPA: RNA 2',3'-cyclic phosphodiesterase, partial [Steroidobacteraceae bacterium]|nr:RNA 2',3'-cyclic phosphodiesterase [Steroidobacteraceae bacterium]
MEPPEPSRRLFFALWPDEESRRALSAATARAVRRCGGRPVPVASLHVTLAFLGSVPHSQLPQLQRIAREQAAACGQKEPLCLTFGPLAHWPRQQILCLPATEGADGAHALAAALRDATAAAGFRPDLKPFRAHVTVARKVARFARAPVLRPVVWRFAAFALLESRTEESGA